MTEATNPSWREYYQKVAQRPPRQLFIDAVERFPSPGVAIDLGCGGGIETRELLRRGWQVIAVDQEAAALELLDETVPGEDRGRLTPYMATFDALELPSADFIWAGLSLPFCEPPSFPQLWNVIAGSLRIGGRFAGDLFGVRHAWRERDGMTFVTREQVEALLAPFEVERLDEHEEERQTAFQGLQHWHGFDIIARKAREHG